MRTHGFIGWSVTVCALGVMLAPSLRANDAAGEWEGPFDWPEVGTHLIHLPPTGSSSFGSVLILRDVYSGPDTDAWLWQFENDCFDESQGCFSPVPIEAEGNLFCAGHTLLSDGTALVAGGHTANHRGLRNTFVFDPSAETPWTRKGDMHRSRWYPTLTTLPDGRVLSTAGTNHVCDDDPTQDCVDDADCPGGTCEHVHVEIPEVYDPATGTWTLLADQTFDGEDADRSVPFYPFIFVQPDGTLIYAGSESNGETDILASETWRIDLGTADAQATWTPLPESGFRGGSAVLFEPGKILKSGGSFEPAVRTTKIFDATVEDPHWSTVGAMHSPRVRHTLTLLADGSILATGGTEYRNVETFDVCDGGARDGQECAGPADCPEDEHGPGSCSARCVGGDQDEIACADDDDCEEGGACRTGQAWVAAAEIIDPHVDEPAWTQLASMETPRMYHSAALLLPDGRVLSAGGGQARGRTGPGVKDYPTAEVFSPPYLFDGEDLAVQPVIDSAPAEIHYGDVFAVATPDAPEIREERGINLVGLAAVTHAFDENQRFVPSSIASRTGHVIEAFAPPSPNHAPPGYYMLFLVDEDGVPSVAKYVQVVRPAAVWVDFTHPGVEEGTFDRPFDTLGEGVQAVTPGGVLRIKAGATGETEPVLTKPMVVKSFGGSATVGG